MVRSSKILNPCGLSTQALLASPKEVRCDAHAHGDRSKVVVSSQEGAVWVLEHAHFWHLRDRCSLPLVSGSSLTHTHTHTHTLATHTHTHTHTHSPLDLSLLSHSLDLLSLLVYYHHHTNTPSLSTLIIHHRCFSSISSSRCRRRCL